MAVYGVRESGNQGVFIFVSSLYCLLGLPACQNAVTPIHIPSLVADFKLEIGRIVSAFRRQTLQHQTHKLSTARVLD
jgi:hypothetical protein